MSPEKNGIRVQGQKQYLISLYQSRSVVALVVSLLVMFLTFMAFVMGLKSFTDEDESIFHYFTVLFNLFSATGAAFMVPYAVEGIQHKRFVLPRWIRFCQYCGALGLLITMTCTLLAILPVQGIDAVTGMNFWMHLITPSLTGILFLCVETGVSFTWREMFLALIPFWVYMAVYYVEVVVIGKENGGWEDIYHTMSFWPAWISALLILALGLAEAMLLRFIHNRRAQKSVARLTQLWRVDTEPVEIKLEVFGLGRYMAGHSDEATITLPMDIFETISDRYGIPVHDLARAYTKGVCDTYSDMKKKKKEGNEH